MVKKIEGNFEVNGKWERTCLLLKENGLTACYNCPYDDCKHTSSYIHPSERIVSTILDIKKRSDI